MTAETDKDKTASGEVEDKAHAISLDDLEPLVPPDGGWAWMILVGSFVAFFFVNAISFSYGVILSDLQTEFECSTTIISLGGSLIVGCTLISGPIVSAMANKFSFRTLVIGGSFVSSASMFASAFVYNISTFLVLFGVITGTSFGFIYLPAATIVSQWFAKRRATATGISMCGSSIGATIYSYILPGMMRHFHWRGAMIIMSALSLNCVAAGCLFIPLRDYQRRHPITKKQSQAHESDEEKHEGGKSGSKSELELRASKPESEHSRHKIIAFHPVEPTLQHGIRPSKQLSNVPTTVPEEELDEIDLHDQKTMPQLMQPSRQRPLVGLGTVNRVVAEVLEKQSGYSRRRTVSERLPAVSVEPSSGASLYRDERGGGRVLFASSVSLRPSVGYGVSLDMETRREIVRQLEREMDLPANRKDFFHSGSMLHVNEYVSSSSVNEYARSVTKIATEPATSGDVSEIAMGLADVKTGRSNYILAMLNDLFDMSLFRSPTFILILASSVFGLLGYPTPFVFLKEEAQTLGYSEESSARLLVYMSALNTVGRVLAGVISDWPCADAIMVNNTALIISGIACILLPVLTSYAAHVCFAATYGGVIAGFGSLRAIILVEMLGLERLTNAFGFLLLFQGVAFMASPPILAGFYDLFKSYKYTFILAGVCLLLSAAISSPLRPIQRWEKRRRGEVVPPRPSGCLTRLIRRARDRLRA